MQYIPVQEDFVIQMDKQYCALESVVGPFEFVISGKINSWDPSTGAMDFQFTAVDIKLFGNKVRVVLCAQVTGSKVEGCERVFKVILQLQLVAAKDRQQTQAAGDCA